MNANRNPGMGDKRKILVRGSGDAGKQLGPYAIEALIYPGEEDHATAYRVKIAPGKKTVTSYHQVAEELYFVLSGTGRAWLDGKEEELQPGIFLRLPPGTRHAFQAGPDGLDLLDMHTPGCRPDHDVYFEGEKPEGFQSG